MNTRYACMSQPKGIISGVSKLGHLKISQKILKFPSVEVRQTSPKRDAHCVVFEENKHHS